MIKYMEIYVIEKKIIRRISFSSKIKKYVVIRIVQKQKEKRNIT